MADSLLYGKFAEYYDKIYTRYGPGKSEQEIDFIEKLARKHKLGKVVLDVACGTGRHAMILKEKGYDVTGVDISEEMLEVARKKVKGVEFRKGDMKTLRLKKKFDIIMCMFTTMIYNRTVEELTKTLKNFHAMLKSPGMVVFDIGVVEETYRPGFTAMNVVDEKNMKIVRFGQVYPDGDQADFNFVFFTKKDGKVDFEIDTHKLGFFSVNDVKNVMKSLGFRVSVFNGFTSKVFKNHHPVFVGIKP